MIPMNDFSAEPEELLQKELQAFERVVRSGRFVLGNEVKEFESDWAARCGTRFSVGVGNGMDAIEIGLRALGIGYGDQVITSSMTAFATILAIMRAGAEPVLADIDPETALMDPESAVRCLSVRTRAVLLVHLYGHVCNMEEWAALCERAGIYLLEDCAQSHGAAWRGKVAGSFGVWGAYSFYPTKNLGGLGDGGALVTSDEEIARKAEMLRNYGQSKRYYHLEHGLNSRLDELQAAVLSVRMRWLDAFNKRRKEIAGRYTDSISNPLIHKMANPPEAENHVYHLYVVRCRERDRLSAYLKERGVSTLIHYPIPAHLQPLCKGVRIDPKGLGHSERHAVSCLSIPCHPQMSENDVNNIIGALKDFR